MLLSRLDRLVLAEIIGPFVFGMFLFTVLFFGGGEALRIAEYVGQGVAPSTVWRLFLLTLPFIVALTFPMASLLSALLGFGRLSGDSEVVALVAGGASFQRIVLPVAAFSFLVSLVGLWFSDAVVPAANRGREAIIDDVQSGIGASAAMRSFTLPVRDKGMLTTLVHIEGGVDLAAQPPTLRNVLIVPWNRGEATGFVFARRATWVKGTRNWRLSEFQGASVAGETPIIVRGASGQTQENALLGAGGVVALGTPGEMKALELPAEQVTTSELRRRIPLYRGGASADEARAAEVEVARRIALPFASFVFALVGAPLGVRPQRMGKGVGFGLSILIIFGYWTTFQLLTYLGRSGALPPILALSLPNLAGIAAAIYLIRRVMR